MGLLHKKKLNLITAEIENGKFEFCKVFKHSKQKDLFAELEGRRIKVEPTDVLFKDYVNGWLVDMEPGMSIGVAKTYRALFKNHILSFFGTRPFSDFNSVLMKKFLAKLKNKKNSLGKPISEKTIKNIFSPLRIITKDAFEEYCWYTLPDPFSRLKLPKVKIHPVQPFGFGEWREFLKHITSWYQPYFEFAVHTGVRPSEQNAIKWNAIDDEFIHIRLSRVGKNEKEDLKTLESNRHIPLRSTLCEILKKQKEISKAYNSPYVFVNMCGEPVGRESLKDVWNRAFKRSGILYRRMYDLRHTFASWALGLGESPQWVARVLGHVDTTMLYKTYGRYIPNLTRNDGSALDRHFAEPDLENKKGNTYFGHNVGHNDKIGAALQKLTT